MEQRHSPAMMPTSTWGTGMMRVFLLISLLVLASACMTQQPSILSGPPRSTIVSKPPTENEVITFIQMINAQAGWALGMQAVLHTRDGGTHWWDVTPSGLTNPIQNVQFRDATTAWLMTISREDPPAGVQVFRTSDAGLHWQRTQSSIQQYGFGGPVQITFLDEHHGWLLSSLSSASYNAQEDVDVFLTVDGGKTWSHIAQTDPREASSSSKLPALGGFSSGLTFLDPSTGWAAGHAPPGQAAYFYVTHDGGSSWEHQSVVLATSDIRS